MKFAPHMPQDPPEPPRGIEAPEAVQEGGYLVVTVHSPVDKIGIAIAGVGHFMVPVPKDGRVEWRLPPRVRGGHVILVTDLHLPDPSGAAVDVVGLD